MTKEPRQEPLTQEEIDEIAIAQAHDDAAWEEAFVVTPISRTPVEREESR
jgi:hypothetical protein